MHRRIKSSHTAQETRVSDQEPERLDELEWREARGMNRRDIIKSMGLAAVLGGGAVTLAGCSTSSSAQDASNASKGGKPIKMLDVGFGDVIPWCVQMANSTKFWGKFFNIEVTHVDGGADPATQLKRFQDAVAQDSYDLVAVTPVASNTLASVAKRLIDKGTPVIQQAVDIGKPGEDIGQLTFISQDYVDVGRSLASNLFERVGGKGTAIVTQGVAGTGNVMGRHQGVQQALKQYPNIELLAEDYTDYSDAASRRLWNSYVQKYPKIDCAVTLTAGSAAINGTYAALKAAGRTETLIGSNNAEDFACQAVIDGRLAASIRHSSVLLGMWAAVIGAQHKTGVVSNVPKITWMPDPLVTDKSTAESMITLQQQDVFLA